MSDALLPLTDDASTAALISVSKGLGFIAVTSMLLYLVLRRFRADRDATARELHGVESWLQARRLEATLLAERLTAAADEALSSPENPGTAGQALNPDGSEIVGIVASIAGAGDWLLAVQVDRERLETNMQRNLSWAVGGLSVALILPLAVGVLLTQRRRLQRMEHVDRQREERVALARHYDTLVLKARDMILLIDDQNRVVDANESARDTYGYPLETLHRMTVTELVAAGERDQLDSRRRQADTPAGTTFESRHRRRDASTFPVEVSLRTLSIDGRRYRQAFIRDISSRRERIEARLRVQARILEESQRIARGVVDAGIDHSARAAGNVQDVTEWRATEARAKGQLEELRRWYEITLDREERIMALKGEVNNLLSRLGEPPRYPSADNH